MTTYNLYCIRHGIGTHNVSYEKQGMKAFFDKNNYDAELTKEGFNQATELGYSWNEKKNIQLVIVSPLTRTLQTAVNIFNDTNCKIIALDCLKEYPQGLHTCNKRKPREELKKKFMSVDFSFLDSDQDLMWNPSKLETIDELLSRINRMYDFIEKKKLTNIALVGHNGFISMIKDQKFNYKENGDEELIHCYPYHIPLKFC